jgi:hypothetical protein
MGILGSCTPMSMPANSSDMLIVEVDRADSFHRRPADAEMTMFVTLSSNPSICSSIKERILPRWFSIRTRLYKREETTEPESGAWYVRVLELAFI